MLVTFCPNGPYKARLVYLNCSTISTDISSDSLFHSLMLPWEKNPRYLWGLWVFSVLHYSVGGMEWIVVVLDGPMNNLKVTMKSLLKFLRQRQQLKRSTRRSPFCSISERLPLQNYPKEVLASVVAQRIHGEIGRSSCATVIILTSQRCSPSESMSLCHPFWLLARIGLTI